MLIPVSHKRLDTHEINLLEPSGNQYVAPIPIRQRVTAALTIHYVLRDIMMYWKLP